MREPIRRSRTRWIAITTMRCGQATHGSDRQGTSLTSVRAHATDDLRVSSGNPAMKRLASASNSVLAAVVLPAVDGNLRMKGEAYRDDVRGGPARAGPIVRNFVLKSLRRHTWPPPQYHSTASPDSWRKNLTLFRESCSPAWADVEN